jgi:hypothetical protein
MGEKSMIKRLMATLAATLALTLGAVGLGAAPASASVYQCQDGMHICFYNYESFNPAGGIYDQYVGPRNVCHVLPTGGIAGWTNGKVYNATTSILLNWTGSNTITTTIYFFDSNACSISSDYWFATTINPGQLNTTLYRLANSGWNDRIGSWKAV